MVVMQMKCKLIVYKYFYLVLYRSHYIKLHYVWLLKNTFSS